MCYILKACGIITIFFMFYIVFLRKDTFFKWNRVFLLIGLAATFILPVVVIPIYIEYTPVDVSNFALETVEVAQVETSNTNLNYVLVIYCIGLVLFLARFTLQLCTLLCIFWGNKQKQVGRFIYIETQKSISPFSFFKWIVYNPNQFNSEELEQILSHEKVHVKEHHSIDVLLMQLACISLWFNPFVWFYARSLKQNLEFLADRTAVVNATCKKSYQYTLLKTSMPTHQLASNNNFYNSFIKKRIVMLHKSKSKKSNQLKLLLILPLLTVFLMSFSTKEVFIEAEVPNSESKTKTYNTQETEPLNKGTDIFLITKNYTDIAISKLAQKLEKIGVSSKFEALKRNNNDEIIAIKIELNSPYSSVRYQADSKDPIKTINIIVEGKGKDRVLSVGTTSGHKETHYYDGKLTLHIETDDTTNNKEGVVFKQGKRIISTDSIIFESSGKTGNHAIIKDNHVKIISDDGDEKKFEMLIEEEKNSNEKNVVFLSKNDLAPLYIVNGKEIGKNKFKNIDPKHIKSIKVLKGKKAIKKYGKKGENGVIEITTKKKK
ncbi:M56 family metallopeptidase [Hyunsoonleella ulvae]|uniref:M56 family metallopeptidase n=1 Tax=Hyunsoonleella ulvae TaxID=2799948 RepID=UPI001939CE2D|nr:M56 family metallopeptidase [Hyunsoonleella ulvae]